MKDSVAVLDIETNLSWDTIWMVGLYLPNSTTSIVCTSVTELEEHLTGVTSLVGHNIIAFDLPILEKLWGFTWEGVVRDTLVLGRLFSPSIEDGHSLREWAKRAGRSLKQDFDTELFYYGLTPEMAAYCIADCQATYDVYTYLQDLMRDFSQASIVLEHEAARIIAEQERNGFGFDFDSACDLYSDLQNRMKVIEDELQELFPPIVEERFSEKTGKRLKDKITEFNVGSRQQVAQRLGELGAVWKDETPSGRPKVDEKTLADNKHIPEAARVLDYLTCQKREGMVRSWIDAYKDGRIYGRVNPCGAVTRRMTHRDPNLAQIPSDAEYRSLFVPSQGRVMVGADAEGLELRCLSHYMQDKEYQNEILNGDIHVTNQRAAGLPTRAEAKTFIYAFLYGAGDAKLGSILGGGRKAGKRARGNFLGNLPALNKLINKVQRIAEGGFLPSIDGGRLRVRSSHAALNTLLQGCGAIVMKQALVLIDERIDKSRCALVASVHDEYQFESDPDYADKLGQILADSIKDAGEALNMRCPMAGKYKVGSSWAETH